MKPRIGARQRRRVRVSIGGTAVFTQSLGVGGFSAQLMRVLPKGSPVHGTLSLDGGNVDYVGEVVWVKPGDPRVNLRGHMGIRFTELAAEGRKRIEATLTGRDSSDPGKS